MKIESLVSKEQRSLERSGERGDRARQQKYERDRERGNERMVHRRTLDFRSSGKTTDLGPWASAGYRGNKRDRGLTVPEGKRESLTSQRDSECG